MVDKVKREFRGTYDEVTNAIKNAENEADKEFRRRRDDYAIQRRAVEDDFKRWLFQAYGNASDKVNEIVYYKAYEDRHAQGFASIMSCFIDQIDFAERILNAK